MNRDDTTTVNMVLPTSAYATEPGFALSAGELNTVLGICNRVARRLRLLDRCGLQRDLAIVQSTCPLDLEELLAAPDDVFVDELMTIIESTDRTTGSLKDSFHSRFTLDEGAVSLA